MAGQVQAAALERDATLHTVPPVPHYTRLEGARGRMNRPTCCLILPIVAALNRRACLGRNHVAQWPAMSLLAQLRTLIARHARKSTSGALISGLSMSADSGRTE